MFEFVTDIISELVRPSAPSAPAVVVTSASDASAEASPNIEIVNLVDLSPLQGLLDALAGVERERQASAPQFDMKTALALGAFGLAMWKAAR